MPVHQNSLVCSLMARALACGLGDSDLVVLEEDTIGSCRTSLEDVVAPAAAAAPPAGAADVAAAALLWTSAFEWFSWSSSVSWP